MVIVGLLTDTVISPTDLPLISQNNQQETEQPTEPVFDKSQFSLSDPKSPWVIVSKVSPVNPKNYEPKDLIDVGGNQQLREEAAFSFKIMLENAAKKNLQLLPLSGYRSYETQVSTYNSEVARFGQAAADTQSARPGHSEHQTGWAIDIGGGGCGIEDCFGGTAEGKWVAKNAYKYGFIIRYTSGKDGITGYRPEPWHLRYVGKILSTEMHTKNVATLEEFFDKIPSKQPW